MSAVKERPIIMSADSVRAILDGRKSQTRRAVRQFPTWGHVQELSDGTWEHSEGGFDHNVLSAHCPYGQPGDRLWVREVAAWNPELREPGDIWYRADLKWDTPSSGYYPDNKSWRSPIHMPRWASRLTLEIVGVRVERLQDISERDVAAELGLSRMTRDYKRPRFVDAWDSLNGKRPGCAWSDNPWAWRIEFEVAS